MAVIFGIKQADGTILGARQFSDAVNLTSRLNKLFNTEEKAYDLVRIGLWDKLCTETEYKQVNREFNSVFGKTYAESENHSVIKLYGVYILADTRYTRAAPVLYRNLDDLCTHATVYLYGPKTKRWVRYTQYKFK